MGQLLALHDHAAEQMGVKTSSSKSSGTADEGGARIGALISAYANRTGKTKFTLFEALQ